MQHNERLAWALISTNGGNADLVYDTMALKKKLAIKVEEEYYTKCDFALVTITQGGVKVPNYKANFLVKFEEGTQLKLITFTRGSPLYFETEGILIHPNAESLKSIELTKQLETIKVPPIHIIKQLVEIKEKTSYNHSRTLIINR